MPALLVMKEPEMSSAHLKLRLDGEAIVNNWRALGGLPGSGAACGAAVKANAYGIGVCEVVSRLVKAGCRDFFVANWEEAAEIAHLTVGCSVTVLNGVLDNDMELALGLEAKPMLSSLDQARRWSKVNKPCDVMINTGMNRLGINANDAAGFDWQDFGIDILASHLASADEDVPQNSDQLAAFQSVFAALPHKRKSLANSAGIALGREFGFDLSRPGLSLFGGIPRQELEGVITPVGSLATQLLQVRQLDRGDHIGYNATFTAQAPMTIGIAALGYADGYLRGFSGRGQLFSESRLLPVLGRVSMDLIAVDLALAADLSEGDWVECPLDLPELSSQSGLSQYEIITGLGARYTREWLS